MSDGAGTALKGIEWSQDYQYFVVNAYDKVLRVFENIGSFSQEQARRHLLLIALLVTYNLCSGTAGQITAEQWVPQQGSFKRWRRLSLTSAKIYDTG